MNTHNKANRNVSYRAMVLLSAMILITAASRSLRADTGTCSGQMITLPFSDVPSSNIFFCAIGEAYFSGLTNGTTATTYSPSANVPREQMAAFVTRTMDQSVKRSSRRAALDQNWSTVAINDLALTTAGSNPVAVKADGADLWVANKNSGTVSRIRASDGKLLETWTGALGASGVLCAMGKVFVTGDLNPGQVYVIDPTQPAGAVEFLTTLLDATSPQGIAFDGLSIWTANQGGSISRINPGDGSFLTFSNGFTTPRGIIFDGTFLWVTDEVGELKWVLINDGTVLNTFQVGGIPKYPAFDGTNIWVPNFGSNTVTVVRATGNFLGTVLTTLSGNGLNHPVQAAFDGERILVTNNNANSVSLWRATDLTPIGTFSTGASTQPFGACSDGLNFWITLNTNPGKLARF